MNKKNYTLFAICISAGLMLTGLSSCKKDDPAPTPTQKNIVEIVVSDPNFSRLKQAVVKAGLTSLLSSGSLTVFAPDNAAFATDMKAFKELHIHYKDFVFCSWSQADINDLIKMNMNQKLQSI